MNLYLVIDRSTFMQGDNTDVDKATAIQLMRMMKLKEILPVVASSDRAEQIILASRNTELSKLEARNHTLPASGGTEIFSGLEMGYNEIIRNVQHAQVNHIILLTDGRTCGDEDKCIILFTANWINFLQQAILSKQSTTLVAVTANMSTSCPTMLSWSSDPSIKLLLLKQCPARAKNASLAL